jgi:hypothetical protein
MMANMRTKRTSEFKALSFRHPKVGVQENIKVEAMAIPTRPMKQNEPSDVRPRFVVRPWTLITAKVPAVVKNAGMCLKAHFYLLEKNFYHDLRG